MEIAKTPKNRRLMKMGICQEPGCGVEYFADRMAKYCEFHRAPKNRKSSRTRYGFGPYDGHQVVINTSKESLTMEFTCALDGCNNRFRRKVRPYHTKANTVVNVYPKYCKEHRNEYKRFLFNRKVAA